MGDDCAVGVYLDIDGLGHLGVGIGWTWLAI